MEIVAIVFTAMVEGILSVVIEDATERAKIDQALQNVLTSAYMTCKAQNAAFDIQLLSGYLSNDEAVHQEMAKLLLARSSPDPKVLRDIWQNSYFTASEDFDIDAFLGCFLPRAEKEIQDQPDLKKFIDTQMLVGIERNTAELPKLTTLFQQWLDEQARTQPAPPPATYTVTATFATQPALIPDQPAKGLVGREDLQRQVEKSLIGGKHVLLLQGFGGMGKTALAATLAARWVAERGPVLWIKAGQADSDALFEGLARPFNAQQAMASAQGEAKSDLLRQILVGSGATLLVIDDAWERPALAPVEAGVPNDLPLLLTSRIRHNADEIIAVGELDPAAALQLLERHAGASYSDDAAAAALCKTLGYHAFAVEIAGKTLQADSLTPPNC